MNQPSETISEDILTSDQAQPLAPILVDTEQSNRTALKSTINGESGCEKTQLLGDIIKALDSKLLNQLVPENTFLDTILIILKDILSRDLENRRRLNNIEQGEETRKNAALFGGLALILLECYGINYYKLRHDAVLLIHPEFKTDMPSDIKSFCIYEGTDFAITLMGEEINNIGPNDKKISNKENAIAYLEKQGIYPLH